MPAVHGPHLRPYGQLTNVFFVLYNRGEVDFDAGLIQDGATSVTASTGFVPNNGGYGLELSALEMSAAHIVLYIIDQSNPKLWVDTMIYIETYGHPLSAHPSIGDSTVQQGGTGV